MTPPSGVRASQVVPGVASGSHGVAVAKLAGNPEAVLMHAHLLNELLLPSVAGILAPEADAHLARVQAAIAAGPPASPAPPTTSTPPTPPAPAAL